MPERLRRHHALEAAVQPGEIAGVEGRRGRGRFQHRDRASELGIDGGRERARELDAGPGRLRPLPFDQGPEPEPGDDRDRKKRRRREKKEPATQEARWGPHRGLLHARRRRRPASHRQAARHRATPGRLGRAAWAAIARSTTTASPILPTAPTSRSSLNAAATCGLPCRRDAHLDPSTMTRAPRPSSSGRPRPPPASEDDTAQRPSRRRSVANSKAAIVRAISSSPCTVERKNFSCAFTTPASSRRSVNAAANRWSAASALR